MKRFSLILLVALLGITSLACMTVSRAVFGEPPTPAPLAATAVPAQAEAIPTPLPPSPTADTCPNGDCITSCLAELNELPRLSAANVLKASKHQTTSTEEQILVTYTLENDRLTNPVLTEDGLPKNLETYRDDRETQERIWNYFAAIIPPEQRTSLTEYVVFTDGEDEILAYVAQSATSPDQWLLSIDILDASNPQDLTFTLIHEYGHLLTLSPSQVPPSQEIFNNPESDTIYEREANACSTYFPGEGCAAPDSYLNQFVERFWGEIYPEWAEIEQIEDEDEYYDALDQFYLDHEDQFITDYAPTSPAEDIAESFSFFILEPKPEGESLAEQKIRFFYEYPELVELRSQMGRGLCAQLEE